MIFVKLVEQKWVIGQFGVNCRSCQQQPTIHRLDTRRRNSTHTAYFIYIAATVYSLLRIETSCQSGGCNKMETERAKLWKTTSWKRTRGQTDWLREIHSQHSHIQMSKIHFALVSTQSHREHENQHFPSQQKLCLFIIIILHYILYELDKVTKLIISNAVIDVSWIVVVVVQFRHFCTWFFL